MNDQPKDGTIVPPHESEPDGTAFGCGPGCVHSAQEHDAFDQGVRDGEAGRGIDADDCPYVVNDVREAWFAGHSVGVMNRREEQAKPPESGTIVPLSNVGHAAAGKPESVAVTDLGRVKRSDSSGPASPVDRADGELGSGTQTLRDSENSPSGPDCSTGNGTNCVLTDGHHGQSGTIVPFSDGGLSSYEYSQLNDLEEVIDRGLKTFVEVGRALLRIRDLRLYRVAFDTFEEYCQARWDFSARRARQLCSAAEVVANLSEPDGPEEHGASAEALPSTESQARPLAGLSPTEQRALWAEAVVTAPRGLGGQPLITQKHVEAVVARYKGRSEPDRPITGPSTVIDVGSRDDQVRANLEAAIAAGRKLIDAIGSADSVAAADLAGGLEKFERYQEHLERLERLHRSRKEPA